MGGIGRKAPYLTRKTLRRCQYCDCMYLGNKGGNVCGLCREKGLTRCQETVRFQCLWCSRESKGYPGRKFCSISCKNTYLNVHRKRPTYEATCLECGNLFVRFQQSSHMPAYCSKACSNRFWVRQRRGRMNARYVEPVYRSVVIERDKGICQLCHEPIDLTLKYPDPGSASVDHIIPVSKEGDHSYANVQLAHLGCNFDKKNRMPECVDASQNRPPSRSLMEPSLAGSTEMSRLLLLAPLMSLDGSLMTLSPPNTGTKWLPLFNEWDS